MSDQPYEGGPYEGYDPYQQQYQQQYQEQQYRQQAPQGWSGPAQGGHDPYGRPDQAGYDPQATQQWQGQTWETQTQPPVPAAETPYPPAHDHQQQAPASYASPVQQPYAPEAHGPVQQPYAPEAHGPVQQPYAPEAHGPVQQPYAPRGHARAAAPAPVAQPEPEPGPVTGSVAGAAAGGAPAYGPATLSGNARITDAQRARLEGRSPIIDPGVQPAALTALLGVLLAAAAPLSSYALFVPLVLLQAVTAAGWFRLNGMWPARQGIALAFAGGLAADAAVLVVGREHAPAAILGPLGIWVLLSLVLQLRSHASPDERMYGLMATVASASLAILATGYLGARPDAVSVGAAAVAAAVLARALPLPAPASVVVAVLAAAGAGIAVGGPTGYGTKGAVLGAAAGVCALIGHRVAGYDYPSRFVHFTAGVALPLSAAAPAAWVLGQALG
ncbi:hypothetical protein QQY24_17270 [Streptomyces sp. TG1A-8]|uniref:hypothetical protein n=1 Tax=Streptomyces sp. TG1A-8 TaxID=3051385 RepID=UPI00265C837E|nr:hypothetical protein [Streptomyces sp. TG1A-8]MDO0927076.1 hypothetical protein [Streptomyces sp. TG1A-8]